MEMLVTGEQSMKVTALNPDGTKLPQNSLSILKNLLMHILSLLMGYLCGTGSKSWTWDDQTGHVWGNMGYLSSAGGAATVLSDGGWWGYNCWWHSKSGFNYKYSFEMTLDLQLWRSLNGSSLTKSSVNRYIRLDMTKIKKKNGDGTNWSIGQLTTTGDGVLFPVQINTGNSR